MTVARPPVTRELTLDVESTIFKYPGEVKPNKRIGHPLSKWNKCVLVGWRVDSLTALRTPDNIVDLQKMLDTSLVIGFNIKFDLHWLRRLGLNVSHLKIWDCQIAEYMLSGQRIQYASLNATAEKYGLGSKLDVIEQEYWSKGIDTDEIPRDVLEEYLYQDLILTYEVYKKQKEIFNATTGH